MKTKKTTLKNMQMQGTLFQKKFNAANGKLIYSTGLEKETIVKPNIIFTIIERKVQPRISK